MPFDFILAGSAEAVRGALKSAPSSSIGIVLIGEGEVSTAPVVARARSWSELRAPLTGDALFVIAEAPSQSAMRSILRTASDPGAVRVMQQGVMRRLRLEDIIGRTNTPIDMSCVPPFVRNKRVLVTGGGGSIGSELVRRIATLSPARVTVLDSSEFNLFRIGVEQTGAAPVLADVRDAQAMRRWMERERPDLVFHAAALKHVPMAESFPCEAVLTNVSGLRNVAEAARATGADLILVSTDKAVDPTGVMGATKRLGELYVRALDLHGGPRAIAVRLGNVIGSTGSVAPLFDAQIAARKPLTVTDAAATRYFMSISSAAEALLLSAAAGLGRRDARGLVMAIDMGEPLPILELAEDMIRLAGLRPHRDLEIRVTGLRPGERLHEFFVGADEWRLPSFADGVIAVAAPPRALTDVQEAMDRLAHLARSGHDAPLRAQLFAAVSSDRAEIDASRVVSA